MRSARYGFAMIVTKMPLVFARTAWACRCQSWHAACVSRDKMHRCAVVGVLLLVATMRGLLMPLPNGCDALLDRYGTECYLPRLAVDGDGNLVLMPGKPAPACAELRVTLDAGCARWRSAKIGHVFHTWWDEREVEHVRQEDVERARWATMPTCPRESFRRHRADCG